MKELLVGLALFSMSTLGFTGFASAQQVTGVLGSPAATTTLSGKQLPPPDPKRDQGAPEERSLEEKRRRLVELLAEIEKRINEENARPKKRYISPATREEVYALYYDALRRKIEERGTRDFPEYQGRKLYGELTMNVTVDASGRVVDAEIVKPSKSRLLDQRALAIVRAASPFGAFTAAMRANADQLVVTSRFRFTREDGLETTLSGR